MPEEAPIVLLGLCVSVCLLHSLFNASMSHSKCILLQIRQAQHVVIVKPKSFCSVVTAGMRKYGLHISVRGISLASVCAPAVSWVAVFSLTRVGSLILFASQRSLPQTSHTHFLRALLGKWARAGVCAPSSNWVWTRHINHTDRATHTCTSKAMSWGHGVQYLGRGPLLLP